MAPPGQVGARGPTHKDAQAMRVPGDVPSPERGSVQAAWHSSAR